MKRLIGLLLWAGLLPLLTITAKAEKAESLEINRPSQAVALTQSVDMSRWRSASLQATFSASTAPIHTLTSGIKESATITVANTSSAMIGVQASVTINVSSITGVSGDSVTLAGVKFTEGTDWSVGASTTISAANLATKIDAHRDFVATSAGSTVTVKYVLYGTSGNGLSAATTDSTYLVLGGSTFKGGVNSPTISINGTTLTETTDWAANSSSHTTARNITVAINANATLAAQVIASSANAVVTITALTPGLYNYTISASTTGLGISGFTSGMAGDIDASTDLFSEVAHGLTTGYGVRYVTTSGTAPGGLTTGTTYFAIKFNEDKYKLASSSDNAIAGTAIDITSTPTGLSSYTMTPATFTAGSAGFYWQVSNDNTNWTDLKINSTDLSMSSVTYSVAGATNKLWDLGTVTYKYLRINFAKPTTGGINLFVRIFGLRD